MKDVKLDYKLQTIRHFLDMMKMWWRNKVGRWAFVILPLMWNM